MEELRKLFDEVVKSKLEEIEANCVTVEEAKAAVRRLTWRHDKLEIAVGHEVEKHLIDKINRSVLKLK